MLEFINGIPMKDNEVAIRIVDLWFFRDTLIKVHNGQIANLLMQGQDGVITPTEALAKIKNLRYDLEQYEQLFMRLSEITREDIASYEKKELW